MAGRFAQFFGKPLVLHHIGVDLVVLAVQMGVGALGKQGFGQLAALGVDAGGGQLPVVQAALLGGLVEGGEYLLQFAGIAAGAFVGGCRYHFADFVALAADGDGAAVLVYLVFNQAVGFVVYFKAAIDVFGGEQGFGLADFGGVAAVGAGNVQHAVAGNVGVAADFHRRADGFVERAAVEFQAAVDVKIVGGFGRERAAVD